MCLLTRNNVTICVLFSDHRVFCYAIKSESTFRNILQMYFVAATCTQKAPAICCPVLVTLVVAAVPVASRLLMLPLIIATFSGFKLRGVVGGGGRGTGLNWNWKWIAFGDCPTLDIFTWHEENSNRLKGIKILVYVYMWGGWGRGCFVACASTSTVYLYVLKERLSVRHTENGGTAVYIEFICVRVIVPAT